MSFALFRPIFAVIFMTLCYAFTTSYATTRIGDITITPGIGPIGNSNHGYAEYRISVLNHSADKMHAVTLILPDKSFNFDPNRIREITRTIAVGPRRHRSRFFTSTRCAFARR